MNSNTIKAAAIIGAGLLLALFGIFQVLAGDRNSVAQFYKLVLVASFFLGSAAPRASVFILLFLGAYVDFMKRLLILADKISFFDLYYVLGIPIAMAFGAFLPTIVKVFRTVEDRGRNLKVLIISSVVVIVGLVSDTVAGGGDIGAAGAAAGIYAYYAMIPIIIMHFHREDVEKLLKTALVIYTPVMIYGVVQSVVGLADFEYDYLTSGLTSEARHLGRAIFRYSSTLNSAHALTMVSAVMIGISGFLAFRKSLIRNNGFLNIVGLAILIIIACWAAYVSRTRAGWLTAAVIMGSWAVFRVRGGYVAIIVTGFLALITLFSFPDQIYSFLKAGGSIDLSTVDDASAQTFQVQTFRDRLFGFQAIRDEPGRWLKPFGVYLSGDIAGDEYIPTHDAFTEYVMKFGYIPMVTLIVGGTAVWFRHFRRIASIQNKDTRRGLRDLTAILVGIGAGSIAGSSAFKVFPISMLIPVIIACIILILRHNEEESKTLAEAG